MANVALTQAEADSLLAMEKHRVDDKVWSPPHRGGSVTVPLLSVDGRESFLLDLRRGRIKLAKCTYQNRARQVFILARLDVGGAPHRNPDDEVIQCPHLHVYREGYNDRWAIPVPQDRFPNPDDAPQTLQDFMNYCNVTLPPVMQLVLVP